jgi:hypothetical protein
VKPHSTEPWLTASRICNPGTISPGPETWIWKAPSDISATRRETISAAP